MDGLGTSLWVQVTSACPGMINMLISLHVAQTVLVLMLPSLYSQELKGIKYILQVGWPGVIWNSYTGYRCLDYFVQHSWGISSPHPVWLSFDHSYMS
jgi:hypothetical protein